MGGVSFSPARSIMVMVVFALHLQPPRPCHRCSQTWTQSEVGCKARWVWPFVLTVHRTSCVMEDPPWHCPVLMPITGCPSETH